MVIFLLRIVCQESHCFLYTLILITLLGVALDKTCLRVREYLLIPLLDDLDDALLLLSQASLKYSSKSLK